MGKSGAPAPPNPPVISHTGSEIYWNVYDTNVSDPIDDNDVVTLCGLHKTSDLSDSKQSIYPWNVEIIILRGGQVGA